MKHFETRLGLKKTLSILFFSLLWSEKYFALQMTAFYEKTEMHSNHNIIGMRDYTILTNNIRIAFFFIYVAA